MSSSSLGPPTHFPATVANRELPNPPSWILEERTWISRDWRKKRKGWTFSVCLLDFELSGVSDAFSNIFLQLKKKKKVGRTAWPVNRTVLMQSLGASSWVFRKTVKYLIIPAKNISTSHRATPSAVSGEDGCVIPCLQSTGRSSLCAQQPPPGLVSSPEEHCCCSPSF